MLCDRAADIAHREDLRSIDLLRLPLQIENRIVVLHIPSQRTGHVKLPALEQFATTRGARDEAPCHAPHDILHESMMTLIDRSQANVTQQVLAQALASDVGVKQKLLFDVGAYFLAQP